MLTASGASANVAQLLQQALPRRRPSSRGPRRRSVDVVPGAKDDPRGTGLASSVCRCVLAGLLVGAGGLAARSVRGRALGVVVLTGAVLAGFATMVIAQGWLGILEDLWLVNALVLSLVVLAIAAVVAGLGTLLGPAGIGIGVLLMMLIGNPWSGVSSAPELLPQPVGDIGPAAAAGGGREPGRAAPPSSTARPRAGTWPCSGVGAA